jgi:hypothetical protein
VIADIAHECRRLPRASPMLSHDHRASQVPNGKTMPVRPVLVMTQSHRSCSEPRMCRAALGSARARWCHERTLHAWHRPASAGGSRLCRSTIASGKRLGSLCSARPPRLRGLSSCSSEPTRQRAQSFRFLTKGSQHRHVPPLRFQKKARRVISTFTAASRRRGNDQGARSQSPRQ